MFERFFKQNLPQSQSQPQEIIDFEEIKRKTIELHDEANKLQRQILNLQTTINGQQARLLTINSQIENGENQIVSEHLGIDYEPISIVPNIIEQQIYETKNKLGEMLKNNEYFTTTRHYTVDNSQKKGMELVSAFCENNILGFNLYCDKKKKSITKENYLKTMDLIDKSFARYNKRISIVGAEFNQEYLSLSKRYIRFELDLKLAKAEEKARIREEKRRLREEQQLLVEAEKERKRLEEERKAMDIAFNKALTDAEREEIKQKLSEIDKRIADVDYRVNNPKAGWVYIIHSDSLPGLEKIGVSRRLSGPHERIRELSGSSLPTPFMLDAFCFSDNAFELESNLHKYFDKQRINPNKEFFRITAKEAINAMENVFGHKAHIVNLEDNEDGNEID